MKKLLIRFNILKEEHLEPFIFVDKNNNPTNEMTDCVKWLKPKMTLIGFSNGEIKRKADNIVYQYYPKLKENNIFIQYF